MRAALSTGRFSAWCRNKDALVDNVRRAPDGRQQMLTRGCASSQTRPPHLLGERAAHASVGPCQACPDQHWDESIALIRAKRSTLLTFVIPRVLDKVVLQHTHQDRRQEAGQQQHRDAAVDDAEPVDLHRVASMSLTPRTQCVPTRALSCRPCCGQCERYTKPSGMQQIWRYLPPSAVAETGTSGTCSREKTAGSVPPLTAAGCPHRCYIVGRNVSSGQLHQDSICGRTCPCAFRRAPRFLAMSPSM